MTTLGQTREPVLSVQSDESVSRAAVSDVALRRPAALVAVLSALGAVVLVPWIAYLGVTLPSSYTTTHWSGTWQGLDVGLVVALAATAVSTWRGWPSAPLWAGGAGVLMLADAWFDLSLSTTGADRVWSVVCACVEVPVALLVLRHGHRQLLGAAGT